ncbi:Mu transposase C-terminal domain-containing protein [Sphingomonas sp. SORGH_AS_0879]|uniref:Mu transposase C-terminal domain-containing protein n=1 Tax=Sphingomonas sp. SORGH_AS_0879 TaxID=3041790 RepID=UPI002784AC9F|nr:Mu transposase C-terminal domain-containing protein [Sphingomonas sp. SORGH_AS_0879]MDQ1229292.1 putative transposase [Sphingomonas sp. SORGH_AS_0879]
MTLLGREYLSAQEIASLELEGLPTNRTAVANRASRGEWRWISRQGVGGGRLFAVADLPEAARRDYADRTAAQPVAGQRGRPKGSDFFTRNPDAADAVEAWIAERDLSATGVLELLTARFDPVPSIRTVRRFISKLEATKPALLASVRDPDLYKSKYRIALGRADASVSYAHQIWEIDTTKADVMTKEGRKSILGIVDVWSRRTFYLVVDSESAQSVRRTLVAAMTAWGVMPEVLRTDQGSGYINATIRSACELIGIVHDPVPPASGDKKPFVERMFGTFTRERAELLGGYIGHNVAEAQRLRARARKETKRPVIVPELTADELQAIINNWLDGVYHVRTHSSLGASPMARWTNSPRSARGAPDEGALKLLLSALVGTAQVTKRGITWKKGRYWTPPLAAHVGRTVTIRRDEDDLGALFVFDEDNRYIGTAVNAERSGLSERDFAVEARRDQAKLINAQRAELREKRRRFSFENARNAVLRRDAEQAGKLVALPVRTVEHQTPTLASIADAPAVLPSSSAIDAAEMRYPGPAARPPRSFEDRMAEADRVLADHDAGQAVDPDALSRARIFTQSTEYRAHKLLTADFTARRNPPAASSLKESSL